MSRRILIALWVIPLLIPGVGGYGILQGQTASRSLLADLKIKASLVRINCLEIIRYSYRDPRGIMKNRNQVSGSIGCGVIVHPDGYILTDRHTISPILDFNHDLDSYVKRTEDQIVTRIFQEEEIDPPDIQRWKDQNDFKIHNSKLLKTVLLSNKTAVNFALMTPPGGPGENPGLYLIRIDLQQLPFAELDKQWNTGGSGYLYYIQGNEDQEDLLPYITNLDHRFQIQRQPVEQSLSLPADQPPDRNRIQQQLEELYLNHPWFWFAPSGQLKYFIAFFPQGNRIFDAGELEDFLKSHNLGFPATGPFNEEINRLLNSLKDPAPRQLMERLNRIGVYFYHYPELEQVRTQVRKDLGTVDPPRGFWRNLSFSGFLQRSKFYLLGILIIFLVALMAFFYRKKRKGPSPKPDLPEEIEPEPARDDLTVEIEEREKYRFTIDIYINGQFHQSHILERETTTLGRDASMVDVVIPELIVSKYHCTILKIENDVYIRDEDSTNGVYDSGKKKIKEKKLEDNENISLGKRGKVKLIFRKKPA